MENVLNLLSYPENDFINLEKLIKEKHPSFDKLHQVIKNPLKFILKKVLHLDSINQFMKANYHKVSTDFIDEVFEYLNFTYTVSERDMQRIPASGRVICVSNHPLGGLDGLALIHAFKKVRKDVKIVVNDILLNISNLHSDFLPYDIYSHTKMRSNIDSINKVLENEGAVLIFPSGEVSRMSFKGIDDKKWNRGAYYFAKKTNSPILPIYINSRNSNLFYTTSIFSKTLSYLLLPHELFNKRNKTINIKIGDLIPSSVLYSTQKEIFMKLLKKHVYLIGKGRKGVFKTEKNIIHPVDRRLLVDDFKNSELLKDLDGKMKLFLVDYENSREIMREIARLRELTFRLVGEGTGKKKDSDDYDRYYKHIVLWDEENLEIAGSYRFAESGKIYDHCGSIGLYTSNLFNFGNQFLNKLPDSIELGRSFVQKQYWNSYALDYLWKGIGVWLSKNNNIKYLYGAVSISNSFPIEVKDALVFYFNYYYGSKECDAHNRYIITENRLSELRKIFCLNDIKKDYDELKKYLRIFGCSIPVLFNHYVKLTEKDGVKFMDFNIDENFSDCVDGLIFVDLQKLKSDKRKRYFES
ncbi:MAG: lysophospholipid acyltransferase family protein [Candidatus Delongbacteria bacterium]|nr:lysophospholipid acyltransferase family protein [Candidatus Delongbacteria bacterium]MBN2837048.1 lysophospholipid acyltransferase family protein [Candidatus Delongbacteria bacterium]